MALAHFNKVTLIGLQNQREHLLKVLQDLQVMEITVVTSESQEPETGRQNIAAKLQGDLDRVEKRLAELSHGLAFLNQIAPVKPDFIQQFAGIKTFLTPREFGRTLTQEERLQTLLKELAHSEQELARFQTQKAQINTLMDNLTPWRELDLSYADLQGSSSVRIFLGGTNQSLAELDTELQEPKRPFYLESVSVEGQSTLFVLMAPQEGFGVFQEILARQGVVQAVLSVYAGKVREDLERLARERTALEQAENGIREKVVTLAQDRTILQVFYDAMINERHRLEVAGQLTHAERSFMVSGWIMAKQQSWLEAQLEKAGLTYVMVAAQPGADEQPPTALQNHHLISPFEYLVQSFSYPQAHEIDPTPAIAPFFFVFFGIALGDAGYGVILALICVALLTKLKLGPVGRKLSWMFLFSGVGAVFVGLLTGSVLSLENIKFGVFNPLQNPILLLVIALVLGLIQLYFGLLISTFYSVREGHWLDALANQGTLMLFLSSVILVLAKDMIGLGAFAVQLNYLLLAAAILMVVGNTHGKKGVVAKLLAIPGGLYNIYNTIGFFSDVLSYSRLMALGLSGGVMGGIMNQLAGMVFNSFPVIGWIFGAAIFLFGHALNLALGVLGAYVHSSRLQYLEFFGKFFEGGGRPFIPFGNKPKYTFLVNEEEA